MRLMMACLLGRRNRRGFGLPGCGRGVTVPISMKAEAERGQAVDALAVLVEPGGQADAVGKFAGPSRSPAWRPARLAAAGQQRPRGAQAGEGQVVGGLGVEREEEGAGEFVEHRDSSRGRQRSVTPP
jgi:hypothetical protein